jgi:NCS1 family nucleobase:cation symporter-1
VLPNLPGFLKTAAPGAFQWIGPGWAAAYAYAWFIGLFAALAVYVALMWKPGARLAPAAA